MRPGSKRRPRGVTLIELLVASALFGLFTGMVATALILAHRTQDASTAKLDAVRRATMALDLLVRDVESARYNSKISMGTAAVPATPTRPAGLQELQIRRNRKSPHGDYKEPIVVGYWYDPGNGEPGQAMVRRSLYDGYMTPLEPLTGEPSDGRILVRDVKEFLLSSSLVDGVTFLRADIWVKSIGNPISTMIATEQPVTP